MRLAGASTAGGEPEAASAPSSSRIKPKKSLGQNFLRDRSVLPRILAAAEIGGDDEVLEIGGGTGVLTRELAAASRRLVTVELDDELAKRLSVEFAGNARVSVWHGGALEFDPCEHFSGAYKLVANIPYYITGPIVRRYLETPCQPTLLVLMVQREVAERMAARPGRLSLLGVSAQYYAHVRVMGRVPPGAFYPKPKVESAIVRLEPFRRYGSDSRQEEFFSVVRAGFGLKRKQLANALMHGLGRARAEVLELLDTAGIDGTRRAESLSIDEWLRLAASWQRMQENG